MFVGSRSQRDVLAPSSGGADTARRRHKRKRESRVPFDKLVHDCGCSALCIAEDGD